MMTVIKFQWYLLLQKFLQREIAIINNFKYIVLSFLNFTYKIVLIYIEIISL